jgi:hypothetical protein
MTPESRALLEALRTTKNLKTRESAIAILEDKAIPWAPKGITAEKLAATGRLGGFLEAVMAPSLTLAWLFADDENRDAICHIVPPALRLGRQYKGGAL